MTERVQWIAGAGGTLWKVSTVGHRHLGRMQLWRREESGLGESVILGEHCCFCFGDSEFMVVEGLEGSGGKRRVTARETE